MGSGLAHRSLAKAGALVCGLICTLACAIAVPSASAGSTQDETAAEGQRLLAELHAVELQGNGPSLELQQRAFAWSSERVAAGDLESAAEVQARLHAHLSAEWTAINLALTWTRLGRLDEAREMLGAFLEREPRNAAAWNHLGQLELGDGNPLQARRHWARAIACGSQGATVSLARLDWDQGRIESARVGFRVGAGRPDPDAWSLRGWALSCLPDQLAP